MKKCLAILICLLMLLPMQVFAASWTYQHQLIAGETAYLYPSDFEDDTGYGPDKTVNRDNYNLIYDFGKYKDLVQKCYIDNTNECVVLVISPTASVNSTGTPLVGTITLWERGSSNMFVMDLYADNSAKEYNYMVFPRATTSVTGSDPYYLPGSYDYDTVSFGSKKGTLEADFGGDAEFDVKINGQSSLFLGYNTADNTSVAKKIEKNHPTAEYHFLTWTATPKFDNAGTLSIYAYGCDYLYQINSDNSVTLLSDKVNSNNEFVITTNTLGSYAMSSSKLNFAVAAASSSKPSSSSAAASSSKPSSSSVASSSSSAAPSSSSSVAPSSSSSVAPSSSSSVAPSSSSSVAPSSSSVSPSSSSTAESSSSAVATESSSLSESSSETESSSVPVIVPVEPEPETKGFPWQYVIIAGMGVVIIALVIMLLSGRGRGKKSRKYDDWDD